MAAIIIITIYSGLKLGTELEASTYSRLKACAVSVRQYFGWDIEEDILNKDEISYEFIDSLKDEEIEMTFFKDNVRYITSIMQDGERAEGTTASDEVWNEVKHGREYFSDGVIISGDRYYVYYVPVFGKDGSVIGMGFAGEKELTVTQAKKEMLQELFIIAVFLIIVFVVILYLVAKKIRKPLSMTADCIEHIAAGDITSDIEVTSNLVETDTLIQSAKILKTKLYDIVKNVDTYVSGLNSDTAMLHTLASQNSTGTEQINSAIEELASTAVTLAENVQDVNAKALAMSDEISAINDNVTKLGKNSEQMKQASDTASMAIETVIKNAARSVQIIDNVESQVKDTNEAIGNIKSAVTLIMGIAEQTNLLSLNASIEAARAGDAGKGFAVVAEEIKKLAEQSTQGADSIKKIAENIFEKSEESVTLVQEIKSLIDEEQGDTERARNEFHHVYELIDDNLQSVTQISDKAIHLDTIKQGITSNIDDLSAISEENAASNEEISANVSGISESITDMSVSTEHINQTTVSLAALMKYFS